MKKNPAQESDQYTQFLEHKHLSWKTPESIIESCIQKAVGSSLRKLTRVIDGESNEVYEVTTANMEHLYIRVSHSEYPRFLEEKFACDKVREKGVPVPEILLIEDKMLETGEKIVICVERALPGTSLRKIEEEVSAQDKRQYIFQIGKVLGKIHECETPFYGWDFLGDWQKFTDWTEYLEYLLPIDKLSEVCERREISTQLIEEVYELFQRNRDQLRVVKPHLLHGDCSTKHFLVENNQLTGVIDFENARGGDPVFDFAWFHFFEPDISIDELTAGYDHPEYMSNFRKKLLIYKAIIGASLLEYYDLDNNMVGLSKCKENIKKAIKN